MATSNIKALLPYDVETVWRIVTDLTHYAWRGNISRIDVLDQNRFVEHTKDGYSTTFTITAFEPCQRYAFDIKNDRITGRWEGLFSCKAGQTTIDFTEDVVIKPFFLEPFAAMYLRKQQAAYLQDLKAALAMEASQ